MNLARKARFLAIAAFGLAACNNTVEMTGGAPSAPSRFGIHVVLQSGSTTQDAIDVTKNYGASYTRTAIQLSRWPYSPNEYNQYLDAGIHVLLNLTWASSASGPVPFPTDLVTYANQVNAVLDSISAPELVVIENEEINKNFHSGPISDYVNMLKTASPIVHAHGLKMTNGAVYGISLMALTFRYLKAVYGESFAAENFGNFVFLPSTLNAVNNPGSNPTLEAGVAQVQEVLDAAPYLDYFNIHYYEVENPNISPGDVPNVTTVTPNVLKYVKEFVENTTGKPIMCNETSNRLNSQPELVTGLLQEFEDNHFPYVIWWDNIDGNQYDDAPLNDGSSPFALRPNGVAFQSFMKLHP